MDLRTGKTYESYDAARADGVPATDIALITEDEHVPRPRFMKAPKLKFTKGSFKPVEPAAK